MADDRDRFPSGGPEPHLPAFEDVRLEAYGALRDVEDVGRAGQGPTREQAEALSDARQHIAAATAALNRAAP